MARRYFVDTNVFMRTAQCHIPDLRYFCDTSKRFLEERRGSCVVIGVVIEEVEHQLTQNKDDYRGAKEVRLRVRACDVRSVAAKAELVERLLKAYSRNGWGGRTSENDKYLAAAASVLGIPNFVTWDREFRSREGWVNEVNAEFGLPSVRFVSPDEA